MKNSEIGGYIDKCRNLFVNAIVRIVNSDLTPDFKLKYMKRIYEKINEIDDIIKEMR